MQRFRSIAFYTFLLFALIAGCGYASLLIAGLLQAHYAGHSVPLDAILALATCSTVALGAGALLFFHAVHD